MRSDRFRIQPSPGSPSPGSPKLNVFQLMAIYNVCFGDGLEVRDSVIAELVNDEIKREGTGKGTKYYIVSIPENIDL